MPIEQAAPSYERLRIEVRARGGDLNESKGHVFSRNHTRTELIAAGLPACMVDRGASGMRNLGGVIGTPALCEAYVANVFANATTLIRAALEMPGAQERTCVIFGALAAKPTFLVGVVPMMEYPGIAAAWDGLLRVSLQRAMPPFTLTERAWRVARLPLSEGGLGVRALIDYADAAFVATHISVMALVRSHCPRAAPLFQNPSLLAQPGDYAVMAARARIVMRAPDAGAIIDAYFAAPVLDMSIQDKLTRRIAAHELVLLRSTMSPREAASNMSHGGDCLWFGALPSSNALTFSNDDFCFALTDRLLVLFTPDFESTFCMHCQKTVDANGYHHVLCFMDGNPDRCMVSDALRDVVACMLRAAKHRNVSIEPRISEDSLHRGDVSSGSHDAGNRIVLDIVTVAPYKEGTVNLAAHIPGIAAKTAEDEKDAKHGPAVRAQGDVFIPLAWEVCGHWGDLAAAFFKKVALQATSTTGEAAAFEIYWTRRLSVVGRKMMASLMRRRLATARRSAPVDPRFLNADPLAHSLLFHHTLVTDARADPAA